MKGPRASVLTPTTFGMISPPFSTRTSSPMQCPSPQSGPRCGGGPLDRRSGDQHWIQLCNRRDGACAPHLVRHCIERGRLLLRFKFVRNGPPGALAVMPSSDCWLYALTLMTIPSMANGSA